MSVKGMSWTETYFPTPDLTWFSRILALWASLQLLRLKRSIFLKCMKHLGICGRYTEWNRYAVAPMIPTAIVLWSSSSPIKLCIFESVFRRHKLQLSEIFWEKNKDFWTSVLEIASTPQDMRHENVQKRCQIFSNAANQAKTALTNFVGFIDNYVILMVRAGDDETKQDC